MRVGPVRVLGILLVLVGLVLIGYVGWQMWGTNWVSNKKHQELVAAVEKQWAAGKKVARAEEGPVQAIVRVPKFGPEFAIPLLEGTSDEVLAAGFAHFPESAKPGGKGNFALAGHRVTHGEPLRDMPSLVPGDEIVIETRDRIYTYVLDTGGDDLSVDFEQTWVLDDPPTNPQAGGVGPIGAPRLLTLVTCAELFHTDERLVAFGHLEHSELR